MLHVSLPLLNFVMKERFSNIGPDPACTAGGFLGWTSPQGLAFDKGSAMVATETDLVTRDSRLATAYHIARLSKVVLDGHCTWMEIGTVA